MHARYSVHNFRFILQTKGNGENSHVGPQLRRKIFVRYGVHLLVSLTEAQTASEGLQERKENSRVRGTSRVPAACLPQEIDGELGGGGEE